MEESAEVESEVHKAPESFRKDKTLWAIVHTLGVLVEEQAEISWKNGGGGCFRA